MPDGNPRAIFHIFSNSGSRLKQVSSGKVLEFFCFRVGTTPKGGGVVTISPRIRNFEKEIKIFVTCKGLEIPWSRTLLDSGFDLNCMILDDFGFCGLDGLDTLLLLAYMCHSFLYCTLLLWLPTWCCIMRLNRLQWICVCTCIRLGLLPSLLGSLWDGRCVWKPPMTSSIIELCHQ